MIHSAQATVEISDRRSLTWAALIETFQVLQVPLNENDRRNQF
jgi:hypothetical protein